MTRARFLLTDENPFVRGPRDLRDRADQLPRGGGHDGNHEARQDEPQRQNRRFSPSTVETHKYQIMEALGLGTTAELIRYALEHGLTTPPRQE